MTVTQVPFAADDEILVDDANAVSGSDVGVVIVIGDGEQGTRMLAELGDVTGLPASPGDEPPAIIVNDAIRRPPSPQVVQALASDVRDRITGVSPLAHGTEVNEPAGPFATNAVDCVNLIALSAVQANSDNPLAMAAQLPDVSRVGVTCRSFSECIERRGSDNRNVDYDGPGGVVEIGVNGDPVRARFDQFVFDELGVDVSTGPLMIS